MQIYSFYLEGKKIYHSFLIKKITDLSPDLRMFALIKELGDRKKMSRSVVGLPEGDNEISCKLIDWYHNHKRDLPWRHTDDPYIIWISEIILQQTRVAQGTDYFLRFIKRFPDVPSLAGADEDEILKYWQGLGYYSRARNLHAAAKDIMARFNGRFPSSHAEILSLKGVGEYTAAAIASFSQNQPYAVVDGNVFRVLSRLFAIDTPINKGDGKKVFTELANKLMNKEKARLHNQAIMEFGALYCVPKNPDCLHCPLIYKCMAFEKREVQKYPVKIGKTKVRNRYFHYFHILYRNTTWLSRREGKDIWAGLYEFPLIETEKPMDFAELKQTGAFQKLFEGIDELSVSIEVPKEKHVLSHQILYATFYRITIGNTNENIESYTAVPVGEIEKYAVPRLIHVYLEKIG